MDKYLIYAMI